MASSDTNSGSKKVTSPKINDLKKDLSFYEESLKKLGGLVDRDMEAKIRRIKEEIREEELGVEVELGRSQKDVVKYTQVVFRSWGKKCFAGLGEVILFRSRKIKAQS